MNMRAIGLATLCLISTPVLAFAQTDEIQVYDGEIAPPGIFNLMTHNNFTPKGRTVPDYPGAIIANHSYQVTAEWAYGVTPWNYSRVPTLTIASFSMRPILSLASITATGSSGRLPPKSGRSWGCTCTHGISSTTRFSIRTALVQIAIVGEMEAIERFA
jgi:hypothetical protein